MIIKNGKIITYEKQNRILEGFAFFVQDGIIVDIGLEKEITSKYPDEEALDAHGQYILPGNICGHTHFYGAFSRGMAIPGSAPKDFPEILDKLWWPLDKSLVAQDIEYSVLICIIDAIKHGTTTLIDHHASQNCIEGSLEIIRKAVNKTGIRAASCYEVTDRDGKISANRGIQENVSMINMLKTNHGNKDEGLFNCLFGLHASMTLSDETLEKCREACPQDIGFHLHIAEHQSDQFDCITKSGTRIVDRMLKFGILGPKTIAAHAVHIDAKEISILADTKTWVTHQPRSNMNNAVGVAPVESMLRSGIKIALGNDGFSNTMWEEMKFAYFVQKLWNRDPRCMGGFEVLEMAVYNTSAMDSQIFPGAALGVIAKGARADIIFLDYQPCTPMNPENLPWHILFGFNESMVTTTIVSGKVLMRDRKLLFIDEEEIAYKSRELAAKAWKRYQSKF